MKECANCGSSYSDDLDSCPECSSEKIRVKLRRGITCPECGENNPSQRSSCQNCGSSLE